MNTDIEVAAKEFAGNWQKFDCFVWDRPYMPEERGGLDDPENWGITYTHHRDSTLIEQSNSEAIEKILFENNDFGDDILHEEHSHWAVGWAAGYAIRVYKQGTKEITPVFQEFFEIQQSLDDYPILDEDDLGEKEIEAALESIKLIAPSNDWKLPEDWDYEVACYLWVHDQREMEDDGSGRGAHPSEESIIKAFEILGYEKMVE